MTVSLALDGEGLGTMWGEPKAKELLAEAGFKDVTVEHVEGDIMNAYYVCRKG
jgi:Zn-dependent membrane protease YugP